MLTYFLLVYILEYNQSRDISLSLYRYVCHHVVGSEETVKTRRMLHTMGENLFHNEVFSKITSGSGGEGLDMRGSDIDIMYAFKDVNVYEDINSTRLKWAETCCYGDG